MPDKTHPTDSNPSPVLAYRGPAPASIVGFITFERDGDMLTIKAPPLPFAGQMLRRSSALFFWVLLIVAAVALFHRMQLDGFCCLLCPVSLALMAAVHAVRQLLCIARYGHTAAVVRVWPGGMEIRTTGRADLVEYAFFRNEIRDVRAYVNARTGGGSSHTATIEVFSSDDSHYLTPIPWQSEDSILDFENLIRERLGLAPTGEFKARVALSATKFAISRT